MTSEQAERRNDLISRQAVLDLLWKLLDNSEYDGDKIIATIDDVEKLVGLESGRMNSKDALKIIGDWISEETHKRKYDRLELAEVSQALIYLKKNTEQLNSNWIPVSEGLPEDEKYYNVTIKSTTKNPVEYCFYNKSKGKFYIVADGDEELNQVWEEEAKNVIAWQPLPEPYKEVEE